MIAQSLEEELNDESNLLFRRVVKRFIKFWWLFLAFVVFSAVAAFFFIRYSPRVYSVGAMVMIEQSKSELDPTDFLFGESKLRGSNQLINRIIVLKSFPVIKETVFQLNQNVSYFRSTSALERVIEIDSEESPFLIQFDAADSSMFHNELRLSKPLVVDVQESGFRLLGEDDELLIEANWDESITVHGVTFTLALNAGGVEKIDDVQYMFMIRSVEDVTSSYQSRLQISLVDDDASIINLRIAGQLPRREAAFIDRLILNFQNGNLREKNLGASNTIDFIQHEIEAIRDSLQRIEGRLKVFKTTKKINNISSDAERIYTQLYELENARSLLKLQEKYLALITEYLEEDNSSKLVSPSAFGFEAPALTSLTNSLLELESKRSMMADQSESQIKRQLDKRTLELRASLKELINNLDKSNQIQLDDLNNRIGIVESSLQGFPVSEIELINIERLYKLSESLYVLLLEKKAEAEITRSSHVPDIRVVENARLLSKTPVKPNKSVVYSAFMLAGLGLPFLWLFYLVYRDRTLRSKDDIVSRTDIPFLGLIASSDGEIENSYLFERPKSRLAESFRTLRSNLKYILSDQTDQIILVSSCFPGEGKTFVSSKLAVSLASANKRVIVVGADLRKPQLQKEFSIENQGGLSTYLSTNVSVEDVITRTDVGVDVILSGPIPPNPMELLDSDRFKVLLTELKAKYDYVIVDTSPFVLVADTKAILDTSDLNIIILRSGYSRKDNLKHIQELADEHGDCKFGIVLNDHNMSDEYSYSYGGGFYGKRGGYGYYEEN